MITLPRRVRRFIAVVQTAAGAALCRRGHHAPLVWQRRGRVPIPPGGAFEMLVASGFLDLAKRIGSCPRCGVPVEWEG